MSRSPLTRTHIRMKPDSEKGRARAGSLFHAPHYANDNNKQGGTKGLLGEFHDALRKAQHLAGHIGLFARASRMLKGSASARFWTR